MTRRTRSTSFAFEVEHWHDLESSQASANHEVHRNLQLNHSCRIPLWLWRPLAKCLGIRLSPQERPVLGTVIYVLLLASCLSYAAFSGWIIVYKVLGKTMGSTFFTESCNIVIGFFWCSIGLYANQLCYNVLVSPALVDSIRLHTRTVLKLNTGVLTTLLCLVLLILHLFVGYTHVQSGTCLRVGLPTWFCPVWFAAQLVYDTLAMLSNLIIFVIVMSIMRTQTIVLRRLIREFEFDARLVERIYTGLATGDNCSSKVWHDQMIEFEIVEPHESDDEDETRATIAPQFRRRSTSVDETSQAPTAPSNHLPDAAIPPDPGPVPVHILTTEDIANRYWKLQRRMSSISLVFQRWVVSWLLFICLWTISYIISWLRFPPSALDVALLVIPLVMFWLLCSSYAEVNSECARLMRAIYPLDSRLPLLRLMMVQPLHVGLFVTPLTYTTILSILIALAVAFLSKIVLDEFYSSKQM